MPLIESNQAPVFQMDGARFTGLAAPSRGSTENAVWRVSVAPGGGGAVHRLTREEVIVALSGAAEVTLAGETSRLEAGSALVVPPHTDFALGNLGDVPFEAVAVLPVGGEACLAGGAPFVPPWAR